MKKYIVFIILSTMIFGLSYFGYLAIQKKAEKKQIESAIQRLPVLSFYTLNQTDFTYKNSKDKSTLIIYFHPDCEHCQYEVKQLFLNKEQFHKTQILLISPASLTAIKQFNTDYQLDKIEPLKLLWDKDGKFDTYFGISTFPTVLIYDSNNKLRKRYKGEVKIEAILKHLSIEKVENLTNQF